MPGAFLGYFSLVVVQKSQLKERIQLQTSGEDAGMLSL